MIYFILLVTDVQHFVSAVAVLRCTTNKVDDGDILLNISFCKK